MIKIAPSILAADPLNLERDVRRAVESGCDWIHVDVMDAHFVPNLAYSPDTVRRLKEICPVPIDVHLMMDAPGSLLDAFLEAGSSNVTVHAETGNVSSLLQRIHQAGATAGVALRPGTPADAVRPYLEDAELILAMTVEPGFGGQKLDESVIRKIRELINHYNNRRKFPWGDFIILRYICDSGFSQQFSSALRLFKDNILYYARRFYCI